jgi:hypothetical protein
MPEVYVLESNRHNVSLWKKELSNQIIGKMEWYVPYSNKNIGPTISAAHVHSCGFVVLHVLHYLMHTHSRSMSVLLAQEQISDAAMGSGS